MCGPGHHVQCNVSRVPCTGLFEICVNNSSSSSLLLRKEKEVSCAGERGESRRAGRSPSSPSSLLENPKASPPPHHPLGEISPITVNTQHKHFSRKPMFSPTNSFVQHKLQMISCREKGKPLIIIFKGVNQTQVKNYGGLAVFLFLLPALDRIQVSVISAESELAPARAMCGKPQSLCTNLFATSAMRGWLQQLSQGGWVSTSLGNCWIPCLWISLDQEWAPLWRR